MKPFRRLVYPMPNEGGLGVHATLDLDGTTRFGPDVEWVERPDYRVDPARAQSFYEAIREYWPSIPDGSLSLPTQACGLSSSGPARQRPILRSPSHVDSSTCSA